VIRIAALCSLAALAGCPDDDPDCFIGDRAADPEMQIIYLDTQGASHTAAAGERMPLIRPDQGGKVLFVGARARNLDGCALELTTSLRDTCTNRIIALEGRPVNLAAGADGWGEPEAPAQSNYGNLAACPSEAAQRDIEEEPYLLRVALRDRRGLTAEASFMVTPFCAEEDLFEECLCDCDHDYEGTTCPAEPDAGVPGACPADAGP
jgi:hypothetical protein